LTGEATPVYSDLELEASMSLAVTGEAEPTPTEEQRLGGYKLVVRAREAMQADALGPLEWDEAESRDSEPE
jgi:hypothetical protein